MVSSLILRVFVLQNLVFNFSIFSCGIGFRIFGVMVVGCVGGCASSVLGEMCRVRGEWSEFRL